MPIHEALRAGSTEIVEPGDAVAGYLRVGERIQIVDLYGKQVCDFIAYHADDTAEVSDMLATCFEQDSWRISEGGALYSTRRRPMLRLTDDKVRVHGYTGGACTREDNRSAGVDQDGCHEAMQRALAAIGRNDLALHNSAMFNAFQSPLIQVDGSFHPSEPSSRAGDLLEMSAEMPVIWALSCCGYPGPNSGFRPTSVEIRILAGYGSQ